VGPIPEFGPQLLRRMADEMERGRKTV
jgi:hypothetical protein